MRNKIHEKQIINLPKEVKWCKKCVMSNQRPRIIFDKDGICSGCQNAEYKKTVDWSKREDELKKLLDKHRSKNNNWDVIVPSSGGKDSGYVAHKLKYEYGMNPLTCTWTPILYTDYGFKNFQNWLNIGGFDNVSFKPNGNVQKILTKLSIENLLHPFQTFILGQKNLAPKIAKQYGINLVFYGENEAEYGNPLADNSKSLRDKSYFTMSNFDDMWLAGIPVKELIEKHKIGKGDLMSYLPLPSEEFESLDLQIHYLGYYIKWIPQEAYYYAVENTGFKARPFRTQGTYSKYNSIDDKIDDLHYYTTYIKFGLGRASYDASQELRNNHLNREEATALVNKFDGEFPDKYFEEIMDFLEIDYQKFHDLCDEFRSPHLWKKNNKGWNLRHKVDNSGSDD